MQSAVVKVNVAKILIIWDKFMNGAVLTKNNLGDAVIRRTALFRFVEDQLVPAMPAGFAELRMEEGVSDVAAVLVAALAEGPKVRRLSRLLLLSEDMVSEIAYNMRAAGLWTTTSVNCEHWFQSRQGMTAFCKDLLVAQGRLLRCPSSTGAYHYQQACTQRWVV